MSPLVTLVLFNGLSWPICKEHWANSWNSLRSAAAFSKDSSLRVHMLHTYGGSLSSSSTVISSSVEILEAHLFFKPLVVNKWTVLLGFVVALHNRQQMVAAAMPTLVDR